MTTHGIKVGEFFVESWGYDQTNIDFYKVVGVTPKGVKIQHWKTRVGSAHGYQEAVVPGDGPCSTEVLQKKVIQSQYAQDSAYLSMTSYSVARLWKGATEYQTATGFGH